MAVTCPTLQNFVAEDMCNENLSGLGTILYFGRKADLKAALVADENEYGIAATSPATGIVAPSAITDMFSSGKGLYKMDCKDEGQQIQGSSLGQNKGFKQQLDFTVEMVNKVTSIIGRALNNYQDLFFIVADGDQWQILYDPQRKCKFESDGIKSDSGKAAADDRAFTGSVVLQPVKYMNTYIKAPVSGWDSFLASSSSSDGE